VHGGIALDATAQRAARNVLDDEEWKIADRVEVIAVGDVGMQTQAGPFLRLLLKVGERARIGESVLVGDLDGDLDVPLGMTAEQHLPEAATAERAHHRVDAAQ
jgi:hypothetical protein